MRDRLWVEGLVSDTEVELGGLPPAALVDDETGAKEWTLACASVGELMGEIGETGSEVCVVMGRRSTRLEHSQFSDMPLLYLVRTITGKCLKR